MIKIFAPAAAATALLLTSACSGEPADTAANDSVRLRNLTETDIAAPLRDRYQIEGDLIPTPSDPGGRYYLLRERQPLLRETLVAILREERGSKAAYARVELDCGRRLFHIVGVGNRRISAETSLRGDGALRPIDGYPLRQEIATFVCAQHGTPLAPADRS